MVSKPKWRTSYYDREKKLESQSISSFIATFDDVKGDEVKLFSLSSHLT